MEILYCAISHFHANANRWLACDVMTAMLVELSQKNVINFYCMWHQHGRRDIVFWILRDWLQVIDTKTNHTSAISTNTTSLLCKYPMYYFVILRIVIN